MLSVWCDITAHTCSPFKRLLCVRSHDSGGWWRGCFKKNEKEKRCEKNLLSSEWLAAFANISSRPPVVLSTCTPFLSPSPAFPLWISKPPSFLISSPTYTHPCPDTTLSLSSTSLCQLLHLTHIHTHHPLIHTPEERISSNKEDASSFHMSSLRFAVPQLFFVIGSSLLQQTQLLLFGWDFTTLLLSFTSVWT